MQRHVFATCTGIHPMSPARQRPTTAAIGASPVTRVTAKNLHDRSLPAPGFRNSR